MCESHLGRLEHSVSLRHHTSHGPRMKRHARAVMSGRDDGRRAELWDGSDPLQSWIQNAARIYPVRHVLAARP